jgi:hypothetical protein
VRGISAKVVPIAHSTLGILINHRDDGGDMLGKLTLARRFPPHCVQRSQERRHIGVCAEPAHYHERPPKMRRRAGGASAAFRRLRSPTRSSRRATCRESTSSASAVGGRLASACKCPGEAHPRACARARSLRGSCRDPALFLSHVDGDVRTEEERRSESGARFPHRALGASSH